MFDKAISDDFIARFLESPIRGLSISRSGTFRYLARRLANELRRERKAHAETKAALLTHAVKLSERTLCGRD